MSNPMFMLKLLVTQRRIYFVVRGLCLVCISWIPA